MNKSDFREFSIALNKVAAAQGIELSAARITVYFDALFDLDIRAVKWAFNESIKTNTFFPKVKELRDLAQAWRPPAVSRRYHETKMIEAPEVVRERALTNLKRISEMLELLENSDALHGTRLTETVGKDLEARRRMLEEQARELRGDK